MANCTTLRANQMYVSVCVYLADTEAEIHFPERTEVYLRADFLRAVFLTQIMAFATLFWFMRSKLSNFKLEYLELQAPPGDAECCFRLVRHCRKKCN
jgi:hypothetical protein